MKDMRGELEREASRGRERERDRDHEIWIVKEAVTGSEMQRN